LVWQRALRACPACLAQQARRRAIAEARKSFGAVYCSYRAGQQSWPRCHGHVGRVELSSGSEAQGALELSKLKDEGDRLFGRKEYQKALDAYDRALKRAAPEGKEERALLHANKAACYLMFQRRAALPAIPARCALGPELSFSRFVCMRWHARPRRPTPAPVHRCQACRAFPLLRRNKEAVNECSSALEAAPAYHKALVRRAKAYEQMGHYKQALSDIQKANKAETANPDTQARHRP